MSHLDLYATHARSAVDDKLTEITQQLRDLADTVDRIRTRKGTPHPVDGGPQSGEKAKRVLHEITWGVANLNLETLMSLAIEAETAPYIAQAADHQDRAAERRLAED
jgi:hypothetical protein